MGVMRQRRGERSSIQAPHFQWVAIQNVTSSTCSHAHVRAPLIGPMLQVTWYPCLIMGRKLLVYDGTHRKGEVLLRSAWRTGSSLYRSLNRVDAALGASSWEQAFTWLIREGERDSLDEVQFWGHGTWGNVYIGNDIFCVRSLSQGNPHYDVLTQLRAVLTPNAQSLVWFRTCETFGTHVGQEFATKLAAFLNARVAGHTHVIGVWQSGLQGLRPGQVPHWSPHEGLAEGTPERPLRARGSWPTTKRSLHFLNGVMPDEWFDPATKIASR
jgi:hypothetical protein